MTRSVLISNIPADLQTTYQVGSQVMATANDSVPGSSFTFTSNSGKATTVPGAVLFRANVIVRVLRS